MGSKMVNNISSDGNSMVIFDANPDTAQALATDTVRAVVSIGSSIPRLVALPHFAWKCYLFLLCTCCNSPLLSGIWIVIMDRHLTLS
mgnify:CR=1 FL=1